MAEHNSVYLWLNWEGWQRFGPSQLLRFENNPLRVCVLLPSNLESPRARVSLPFPPEDSIS